MSIELMMQDETQSNNAPPSYYKEGKKKKIEELTCCTALSARSANSTDRPFKACFRVPHVLLFKAAQDGSGVVSEPKALGEDKQYSNPGIQKFH